MPVINASATRQDIRVAIGDNLNAIFTGTASSGSTTTVEDLGDLRGGTDEHIGKWVMMTSGSADENIRQVSAYNSTTRILTVDPAFSAAVALNDTYELWKEDYPPVRINRLINQAIHYLSGKAYDPTEDISLHLHGDDRRYVIPGVFAAIKRLERRAQYSSIVIDPCESGWTQQTNVTQVFDTTRLRQGGSSLRLVVAGAAGANADIASKTITSLDISKYDRIEMWVLSNTTLASGDLTLRLTSGAVTVSFNIPAVTANTWTFVRMTLNPNDARQLTAVTTVVVRQVTDVGGASGFTAWFDDIKAAINSSAQWVTVPQQLWYIDKEATEIVFKPEFLPPYQLLKILGGDEPVLLNADGTTTEVDPFFVIAKATELALMSASGGTATDPDEKRTQVAYWAVEAHRRVLALPSLAGYRQVT